MKKVKQENIFENYKFIRLIKIQHINFAFWINYKKEKCKRREVKEYIEERTIEIANYIIECNATVRQAAKTFGVSKSTVHKDCTERLGRLNPGLAKQVRKVLDVNKSERHIRGGLATKEKYAHNHA